MTNAGAEFSAEQLTMPESAEGYQWHDSIWDRADPWRDWLSQLGFPRRGYSPLDAQIEHEIEDACRAADERRLAIVPTTKHFADLWADFRQEHEYLESTYHRRRLRWLIWRAAALKVKHKYGSFQDVIDYKQCHDKIAATERLIGHADDIDDWLWSAPSFYWADGTHRPDPLSAYAATVLSLMRTVVGGHND